MLRLEGQRSKDISEISQRSKGKGQKQGKTLVLRHQSLNLKKNYCIANFPLFIFRLLIRDLKDCKGFSFTALFLFLCFLSFTHLSAQKPWDNGQLRVSRNHRYLEFENGTPFFWLGNTAWLLPHRCKREDVDYFLQQEKLAGFNVEQIQVINAIPTINDYGSCANDSSFRMDSFSHQGENGFWEHLDYIVERAESLGIYIAMDCIWGSQVKHLSPEKATLYGSFLAQRYQHHPNIIWMIGGDIQGDRGTESWNALALAIKQIDKNHLMTFHPRGRTTSADWWADSQWLDFHLFQSGHRRYGQRNGDANYPIEENTEEDNWRYVYRCWNQHPLKPVIDGEPSYEDIPQGLHDTTQPRWKDYDVRRYAYWSVFAGSCGHTYGHNSIMQFMDQGREPAYGAKATWKEALQAPGRNQLKHLKHLMLSFPFDDRVPDSTIIIGEKGERYNRLIATRGKNYLLVYNYTGRAMNIDLSKIQGKRKQLWLMNPVDGSRQYLGTTKSKTIHIPAISNNNASPTQNSDRVLIAVNYSDKKLRMRK